MSTHPPYRQTCAVLTATQNNFGDQVESSRKSWACHFREVAEIESGNNRESLSGVDAFLWIDPESGVVEGSIIYANQRYWRVNRLTHARRFTGTVLFLKCRLEKHNVPLVN